MAVRDEDLEARGAASYVAMLRVMAQSCHSLGDMADRNAEILARSAVDVRELRALRASIHYVSLGLSLSQEWIAAVDDLNADTGLIERWEAPG